MATVVNIGSGSGKSSPPANSAANSTRALNAANLINGPSASSTDGSVAVSTGKLGQSKLGNIVDGALDIASNMPGVVGSAARIGKKIKGLFSKNDPEWWMSVPGDGITTNAPLREVGLGEIEGITPPTASGISKYKAAQIRPMMACYSSALNAFLTSSGAYTPDAFMHITDQMATQYLMPEIRKVVNAIPLQEAQAYRLALANSAAAYALWRNLLKYDYLLKHGQTYLASLNDAAFPVLQVTNAAWLQSTIGRLEEFLRASVRIPHTLCEYLAWRYGRIYRASNNAKAALVMHNVISLRYDIAQYDKLINAITTFQASTASIQQANTDIYNAYYDHDMQVEIADENMFAYDAKEWLLRTNLDLVSYNTATGLIDGGYGTTQNPVIIDSALDNPTTFMASTVSTTGKAPDGTLSLLFPTTSLQVFTPYDISDTAPAHHYLVIFSGGSAYSATLDDHCTTDMSGKSIKSQYYQANVLPSYVGYSQGVLPEPTLDPFVGAFYCKALDIYCAQQYVMVSDKQYDTSAKEKEINPRLIDVTAVSCDLGVVEDQVLGNEHVYAFANLVNVSRKQGKTARQVVTPAAKAIADMVASPAVAITK